MKDLILKGDICYSVTPTEMKTLSGYLVCKEGKCAGVFEKLPKEYCDFELHEHTGKLIIPGFVDLHIHAPQYAFRGMGMDAELIEWLNTQTFPEEAKYSDLQYAKRAYTIFAENIKKSATTRASIFATRHVEATKLLMDLMEQTGVVSYVGKVNMDRFATEELQEEDSDTSAFATFAWINSVINKYDRTKPILTPRFIPSCSDALMDDLREIQRTYNLPVQSHLSENKGEIEWVKELRPDSEFYGDAYSKHDLFGSLNLDGEKVKAIMAHCVWSGDDEIERMHKNEVFIAHCPASNMNLSSGIAPIRKYLKRNMKIGLGSDVAGGHTESMFRAITDTIQASKMYMRYVDENSTPVTFAEAFYLATKGGGEFFGDVGSFENGYEFDALVLDDSILAHPLTLDIKQRVERSVYLSLDLCGGIIEKYVQGNRIF